MGRKNRKLSAETKLKMRNAKIGAKNPMYGKKRTNQEKIKISKSLTDYWKKIP